MSIEGWWKMLCFLHQRADRHVKIELFPLENGVEITIEPNPHGKVSVVEPTFEAAAEKACRMVYGDEVVDRFIADPLR